jgi:adenosine deaminase
MLIDPTFPLTDLHRHLEGSVRLETVIELSKREKLPLPAWDVPSLRKHVWLTEPTSDFLKISPKFSILTQAFVDTDACRRITWECIEDAGKQGLDYLELRFSPLFMAEPHRLDPFSVTAAVCEAWQEARARLPIETRLSVILSRTYGPEACQIELACVLKYHSQGIHAIDLAGDEANWPAALFVDHFRRAKEAGLHLTAHAGEFAGAQSVRDAVELLNVERIGHAVHAVDDPRVMDLLARYHIAVECCPTSNVLTRSVRSLAEHPLPKFLAVGIPATLNTDDPTLMSDLILQQEYKNAAEYIGLNEAQLARVQQNGLAAAFLSQEEKQNLVDKCQSLRSF